MKQLSRAALLGLGWSAQAARSLQMALDNPDVTHVVAWRKDGRLAARAHPSRPPDDAVPAGAEPLGTWRRSGPQGRRTDSRTQQALLLIHEGLTPNAAARQVGISPSGLYKILKSGTRCPCCGTILRSPSDAPDGA